MISARRINSLAFPLPRFHVVFVSTSSGLSRDIVGRTIHPRSFTQCHQLANRSNVQTLPLRSQLPTPLNQNDALQRHDVPLHSDNLTLHFLIHNLCTSYPTPRFRSNFCQALCISVFICHRFFTMSQSVSMANCSYYRLSLYPWSIVDRPS